MSENEIYSEKKKILDIFLATTDRTIIQRSAKWHEMRKNTIGGSDISKIIGKNKYGSTKSFIAEKIGISSFEGNAATRWGSLFEMASSKLMELILRSKIIEIGSVDGPIHRVRYSPDGIALAELRNIWYIILLEFKAPHSTIPDGIIPSHYEPQVQTGLMNVYVSDICLFVNNCFRKCSIENIVNTSVDEYDVKYHKYDAKKRKHHTDPLCSGIIFISQSENHYEEVTNFFGYTDYQNRIPQIQYVDVDVDILINSAVNNIDFGKSDSVIFDRLLYLIDKKLVKIEYSDINILPQMKENPFIKDNKIDLKCEETPLNTEKIISDFQLKCKSENLYPIGYIPWKLYYSDIIEIKRNHQWQNVIKPKVQETLEMLDSIMSHDNPHDMYNKKFNIQENLNDSLNEEDHNKMNMFTVKKPANST